MRALVGGAAILAVGLLAVIPLAKHFITSNEVERELDTAMYEYQTLTREAFHARIERIADENQLDPRLRQISFDESIPTETTVTIQYESRFRVFFLPISRDVTITRHATKLGV